MEETTSQNGWTIYKYILALSVLTLGIMACRVNSHELEKLFFWKSSTTTVKEDVAKVTKECCIDGERYDSKAAVIYQGDVFGDSASQAKSVRKYIRPYLKEKGYEQYTDIVVAICAQESRFGLLADSNWMQVKGYCGDSGMVSVKAGADHFMKVVQHASKKKCKDITVVIQAYNFGTYYIDYCMERGGRDTKEIRTAFWEYEKQLTGRKTYGDPAYAEKVEERIKKSVTRSNHSSGGTPRNISN